MEKEDDTKRFSASELSERRARGESRSDLSHVEGAEELESAALLQMEKDGISADWFRDAQAVRPEPKKLLSLRLDNEIVDWFRSQGPGYQTRINAVLKAYIKHAPR